MPPPDPDLLRWAVQAAAPGAEVAEVRGLRDGGSPWLLRLGQGGRTRDVVLRVGDAGDLPGLRTEDTLHGLIDWDGAGAGAPGVDLGSLRCDAAICFGLEATDDIRHGWEAAAGRAAADLGYWDMVAALSTPPDMGWFLEAIAGQGRPDLTRELLVRRRDDFLRAALDRLDAEGG
jgi:hypothetical protein